MKRSSIVSVMMQYSLLDRRPEEDIFDLLAASNIGVLCRGALAQGLLVNKPAKEYLNYRPEEVKDAQIAVHLLSGPHRTPAQTAVRFVLQHPAVTSAVIGIRTMDQLEEVVSTVNTTLLTSEEIQQLQQSIKPGIYEQHR